MIRRPRGIAPAVLAALGLASAAAFARGAAALPADADSSIRSALTADSVWVMRFAADSTHLDDQHQPKMRVAARALAAPGDARRFAALLRGIDVQRGATPHSCADCPGALRLLIGFHGSGSNSMGVRLLFPERAAFFSTQRGFQGVAFFDSIAPELLQLSRRTLASDSPLQRYVLPPIDWGAKGRVDVPRIESVVETMPEADHRVPPRYPDEARRAGVSGTVMVKALVGADGRVMDARIETSIPTLDAAALEAVRRWTFKPARAQGRPVAVWVSIPVRFTLH